MALNLQKNSEALTPVLKAFPLSESKVENFNFKLQDYFSRVDRRGSRLEATFQTHFIDLLKFFYDPEYLVEPYKNVDFVIRPRNGKSNPLVLFEAKRERSPEMIRENNFNRKAMHEMILYYMRERAGGNTDIRKIVIHSEYRLYIFDSSEFYRNFYRDPYFRRRFEEWREDHYDNPNVDFFYEEIARKFISENDIKLNAAFVDLRDYRVSDSEKVDLIKIGTLYKLLSAHNLLKIAVGNDSNVLNQAFYDELLHIIGLEERKIEGIRGITRLCEGKRHAGSLIENTIARLKGMPQFERPEILEKYGTSIETRTFNIALELCLTWVNRILFLKLLEAQLLKINNGDRQFQFLNIDKVKDFNDLSDLFFMVLAVKADERNSSIIEKFRNVPFLNSSLFERTDLELDFVVSNLNNHTDLPVFQKTVLKDESFKQLVGEKTTLKYLFEFLSSYDFGSESNGEFQNKDKPLINASVLGLIFEKINGYQDGAIYTPGYITMYMAREVIEKTVFERFQKKYPDWKINDLGDLKNYIIRQRSKSDLLEYNNVIDELKICDPAVGSGHFLVSCLNELIAIKSYLDILVDREGELLTHRVLVENDELVIMNRQTDALYSYHANGSVISSEIQEVQECLFHEKQKLIENCLFGVDININSVHICQLRLWIELLKSAYYQDGKIWVGDKTGELETLPSIDINIKCGNSLLSRFNIDESLESALKRAELTVKGYKSMVQDYKKSDQIKEKLDIQEKIANIKKIFQEESLNQLDVGIETKERESKEIEDQLKLAFDIDVQATRRKKISEISEEIKKLKSKREMLIKHKTFLSTFEWRYEFPEVLDDEGNFLGFDIVITNPPYMRIQEIERTQREQKDIYERNFPITTTGKYELANIFFELALSLSKNSGNNIFIFPNKVFNSENGAGLRHYLLNNQAVKKIAHFGANQIFDGVSTYSCVVCFNKQSTSSLKFRRFEMKEDIQTEISIDTNYTEIQYSQIEYAASLYGGNYWILFNDPIEYDLFSKCYNSGKCINEELDMYQGIVTTGMDSLYISKKLEETEDQFKIQVNPKGNPMIEQKQFWVEREFFKPLLKGKNIGRYSNVQTSQLVFFPYLTEKSELVSLKELSDNFPLTWKFVTYYEENFKARQSCKDKNKMEYYKIPHVSSISKYDNDKLLSMDMCTHHPNLTLDTNSTYHFSTIYGLTLKDGIAKDYRYYLGILNSKLFWWFLKHTGDALNNDGRRVKNKYVNPFPLPAIVDQKQEQALVSIVEKRLNCNADQEHNEEIDNLEKQINSTVYKLYGLEEFEIQIVENVC